MPKSTAMKDKLPISRWAEDDRPREKLLLKGKAQLSKAELIAILIGSGNKEESAVELSKKILNSVDNNLAELSKLGVKELCMFNGIGEAKAISIIAALEIGRRRRADDVIQKKKKLNPVRMPMMFFTQTLATKTMRYSGYFCSTGQIKSLKS